jgi:hypothetical protein
VDHIGSAASPIHVTTAAGGPSIPACASNAGAFHTMPTQDGIHHLGSPEFPLYIVFDDGLPAPSTVGVAGTQTVFPATGEQSVAVVKSADFTASPTEAFDYEITAVGKIVTLASTDALGTIYQFHNCGTGFAASPTVLTPDGGKLINGASSYSFDRDYGSQYARRLANGDWLAGQ